MSAVSEETVQALRKHIGELEHKAKVAREMVEASGRERLALAKLKADTQAELAELRRKHDEEIAAERAALAKEQAEWKERLQVFRKGIAAV